MAVPIVTISVTPVMAIPVASRYIVIQGISVTIVVISTVVIRIIPGVWTVSTVISIVATVITATIVSTIAIPVVVTVAGAGGKT